MDKPFCINCAHHKQVNGAHLCLRNRWREVSLVTGIEITTGPELICHKERSSPMAHETCKPAGNYFKAKE